MAAAQRSFVMQQHRDAVYGRVIGDLLVVGVYVRNSPNILCVEPHPLDLHFHSVSHMIACTHTHKHTHQSWCNSLETIRPGTLCNQNLALFVTRTAEVNVLVLVIGAAPQTPGMVGQGEQVLQPRRVSDGSV